MKSILSPIQVGDLHVSNVNAMAYGEILRAVSKIQKGRSAIIILQEDDGSTTILRLNLPKEQLKRVLKYLYDNN